MKKLTALLDGSFWRFIIVGMINTVVGTAIMFGLYNIAGCGYWFSSAMNYICASILSYFLNKYFTFRSRETGWRSVVRFAANITVCYLLAYGAAKPLVRMAFAGTSEVIRDNAAMLAGMCLFVVLNYLGQRLFVFKKK